ncbi:MAG TPA: phosphatase PAP2 family protein [Thermoleophilaceae bacterium]|nr:phosphatase PAP2 family protein [Thermoleophilaceae bacterium]
MVVRPSTLLKAAALCAVAFLAMLALAYGSPDARWLDASAFQGFLGLQRPDVSRLTTWLGQLGDPPQVAAIALVLAGVALARGRPRMAALVLVLVGLTSISSQLLKALLAYPRYDDLIGGAHVAPAAFPSGHATASMTLAIALVLVVSPRLRPAAAVVGAALALGVSFSVVSMGWHFPSDVIGGFLLATGWSLVLLAGLRALDARYPERAGRGALARRSRAVVDAVSGAGLVLALVAGGIATAIVVLGIVAFRLPDLVGYAQEHTVFFVVAALLVASVAVLLRLVAEAAARRG